MYVWIRVGAQDVEESWGGKQPGGIASHQHMNKGFQ